MKNIVEIYCRSVPRRIAVYGNLRFRSKRRSGQRTRRTVDPNWRRWARNCGRLGAWTAPAWSYDWVLYPETRHHPEVTSVQHSISPPLFPERGRRPTCTPRHYPSALVGRPAVSLFFLRQWYRFFASIAMCSFRKFAVPLSTVLTLVE